jgi:HAD superfamily hydrolase (TIGR01509 family)
VLCIYWDEVSERYPDHRRIHVSTEALALPDGNFAAYLFDLDGTVADSMPLHFIAWTDAVKKYGATFPEALFYGWGGVPPLRVVELLNEKFGYTMDPETVVAYKEAQYILGIDNVQPIASVLAHVTAMHGKIPLAIVSGSPREGIGKTLAALKLSDTFDVIVGAEDYSKGKPDPEPFLTAAKLLGVDPAKCLVFEDADAGIASAEAAGMKWVRVPLALPDAVSHGV